MSPARDTAPCAAPCRAVLAVCVALLVAGCGGPAPDAEPADAGAGAAMSSSGEAASSGDEAGPFAGTRPDWCAELPRPVYATLDRVDSPDDWFQVYQVAPDVYAIYEPHQFQEVISYLVVGAEQALLFDTGMGIGRIADVVDALADVPVVVLNSHTHPDHVGGNAEFREVLAMDTDYTRGNAAGFPHQRMAGQVAADALCRPLPAGVDSAGYRIRPFAITGTVDDGALIDLDGRVLEVLAVPGHTPDAVALLDRERGLLFTGDTFYEGPIYLFAPETDLDAYAASVERLAALAPGLEAVLPGHNGAVSDPALLVRLRDALQAVRTGGVRGERRGGRVEYPFDGFSLLMRAPASDADDG